MSFTKLFSVYPSILCKLCKCESTLLATELNDNNNNNNMKTKEYLNTKKIQTYIKDNYK